MNYREIWKSHFGEIPKDSDGRTYEIHHIDGDNTNNVIDNLKCLSIKEHYDLHYSQGDYLACLIMTERMQISQEERLVISKLAMQKRDQRGSKNPMYGKSTSKYITEVWENRDSTYREKFGEKISKSRKELKTASGNKNPMYGRSAVSEKKLRWYNNGLESIYVSEGTQPAGYNPGRGKIKWK